MPPLMAHPKHYRVPHHNVAIHSTKEISSHSSSGILEGNGTALKINNSQSLISMRIAFELSFE